jgi:ATP phosphoribosyltransferase regulatory subunit
MELDFDIRRPEEKAMLVLRRLYELYGYRKYKVSNFEEYGLYLQYKSFLSGDKILSFTDLDGRLLALRPDVTLSIIKNARDNETAKAYYIENVYRESKESNTFKEINQMGLEYMGHIDYYAVAETVSLAQQSLQAISEDYILELGHMGFVTGLLDRLELLPAEREEVIECLAAKSPHRLKAAAVNMGLSNADQQRLLALVELGGAPENVLDKAEEICSGKKMQAALDELRNICKALGTDAAKHIRVDFSLLNDTEFYDGILMSGYLPGLPRPVLFGGRYDSMMYKLGHKSGAIGFAVYLDELERLPLPPKEYDIDVWVEAVANEDAAGLLAAVRRLTAEGLSVRVADELPAELTYRRHCRYQKGELLEC